MGRVLDNHALGVKTRLRMELFRRFPVQEERPLRRTQHAGKKLYKGRFSCAVFPDKGDLLARMQGEIHTLQRISFRQRIAVFHAFCLCPMERHFLRFQSFILLKIHQVKKLRRPVFLCLKASEGPNQLGRIRNQCPGHRKNRAHGSQRKFSLGQEKNRQNHAAHMSQIVKKRIYDL